MHVEEGRIGEGVVQRKRVDRTRNADFFFVGVRWRFQMNKFASSRSRLRIHQLRFIFIFLIVLLVGNVIIYNVRFLVHTCTILMSVRHEMQFYKRDFALILVSFIYFLIFSPLPFFNRVSRTVKWYILHNERILYATPVFEVGVVGQNYWSKTE